MPNKNLILFLEMVPIINSYIYSYYMYYAKRFKDFTTTIVNIPYYIVCSMIFYCIVHLLYAADKSEIFYIYMAIAFTSTLYTVLSAYFPKLTDTINPYVPIITQK